jgi:phosphohistidine phosphatase
LKVYLIRHGEARMDGERHLSQKGIEEVNSVCRKILEKKITVDEIFHSGKVRAKETCEILVNKVFKNSKVTISDDLSPESDISIWGTILNTTVKDLLLVGHLPYLSDLVYYLSGDHIGFQTADIVCLEQKAPSKWEFCWKIEP